jgi:hypothetical protein
MTASQSCCGKPQRRSHARFSVRAIDHTSVNVDRTSVHFCRRSLWRDSRRIAGRRRGDRRGLSQCDSAIRLRPPSWQALERRAAHGAGHRSAGCDLASATNVAVATMNHHRRWCRGRRAGAQIDPWCDLVHSFRRAAPVCWSRLQFSTGEDYEQAHCSCGHRLRSVGRRRSCGHRQRTTGYGRILR